MLLRHRIWCLAKNFKLDGVQTRLKWILYGSEGSYDFYLWDIYIKMLTTFTRFWPMTWWPMTSATLANDMMTNDKCNSGQWHDGQWQVQLWPMTWWPMTSATLANDMMCFEVLVPINSLIKLMQMIRQLLPSFCIFSLVPTIRMHYHYLESRNTTVWMFNCDRNFKVGYL